MSINNLQKVHLPKVIFGTSGLGNLYVSLPEEAKRAIVRECIIHSTKPAVFDSAGKYGAGLALESLGRCLKELNVKSDDVIISNKLGWYRTELKTSEPTFEPGVWRDLKYDAVQKISYEGILECYEQGNQLLGDYRAALVSVHDPDEYIGRGRTQEEVNKLYKDVLEAYRALNYLKLSGQVKAIGIGSKDWRIIKKISEDVELDWVMIANSMTVHTHPLELTAFMEALRNQGIAIINSAVFNAGFLIGADYYNYKLMHPETEPGLYQWRRAFFKLCRKYEVQPAEACVVFGLKAPGVCSVALSTTNAGRVKQNIATAEKIISTGFWIEMKAEGLISGNYNYLD